MNRRNTCSTAHHPVSRSLARFAAHCGSVACLASLPLISEAAIVTLNGSGFDVTYDTALLGQFGPPTLSANGRTILFNPTGFSAQSTGTNGTFINADSVRLDITPNQGGRVAAVTVLEAGDYKLVKRSGASLDPAVDVSGELRMTNLYDGVSFVQSFVTVANTLSHICSTTSCLPTAWTAAGTISAPASWSDHSGSDSPGTGAPSIRFFLQDILMAESFGVGDSAFIQKKQASQTISVDINVVGNEPPIATPLPAALPLLTVGVAGLGLIGRRRGARTA